MGWVSKMSDRLVFSANDVVNGKVDVENLRARYVLLKPGLGFVSYGRIVEGINVMAKFGWRAVGFSRGYCLLEKVE